MPRTTQSRLGAQLGQIGALRQAQDEADELRVEVERLRAELEPRDGKGTANTIDLMFEDRENRIIEVPISEIQAFAGQPRKTFTSLTVDSMARSLEVDGQQDPVKLIRDIGEGRYTIWDGEIRWRAAKKLGWTSLQARFVEMPEDLHWEILKGFFARNDLNGLDRAEAVISTIERRTAYTAEVGIKSLRSGYRKLERSQDSSLISTPLSTEERHGIYEGANLSNAQAECIEQVLRLGVNLSTFVSKDLNLLSLPEELKEAIRNKGLPIGIAKLFKKIWIDPPNVENIEKVRAEVIERGVSMKVHEARELVKTLYPEIQVSSNIGLLLKRMRSVDIVSLSEDEKRELIEEARMLIGILEGCLDNK